MEAHTTGRCGYAVECLVVAVIIVVQRPTVDQGATIGNAEVAEEALGDDGKEDREPDHVYTLEVEQTSTEPLLVRK